MIDELMCLKDAVQLGGGACEWGLEGQEEEELHTHLKDSHLSGNAGTRPTLWACVVGTQGTAVQP